MPDTTGPLEAPFGSLDPQVASDIALLREFGANREQHMTRLFGRRLRRSPTRDEILRLILLAFAQQQYLRVATYVRACGSFASAPSIRAEINLMRHASLVTLLRDAEHPKALLVAPTVKLIDFYNKQMPRLRDEVAELLGFPELLSREGSTVLEAKRDGQSGTQATARTS